MKRNLVGDRKTLVFIPTYNERENVHKICQEILNLDIGVDILFLDDNSPDGTGKVIDGLADRYANIFCIHRSEKEGIGSAHVEGINWAYSKNYDLLITMDCDFSHPPSYIPAFIKESRNCDLVVGSRYMTKRSLAEWNLYRRFMTNLGHFLTSFLLKIKFDASGAFRAYDLNSIDSEIFRVVSSKSYSFFFESLYIIFVNNFRIKEIPIHLPARVYGHSKMRIEDIFGSLLFLFKIYLNRLVNIERYYVGSPSCTVQINQEPNEVRNWDSYWETKNKQVFVLYNVIASFYRKHLIRRVLNRFAMRHFRKGSRLLHAGCGSGEVDSVIREVMVIQGLDISKQALNVYGRVNGNGCRLIRGDLLNVPVGEGYVDGIYNLGVMEHFEEQEIISILREFNRILKGRGKIILFWPPEYGLSVTFLKAVGFVLNTVFKKNIKFHPDEPTRINTKGQIEHYLMRAGFDLVEFSFGPRDAFTYAVVVGQKK